MLISGTGQRTKLGAGRKSVAGPRRTLLVALFAVCLELVFVAKATVSKADLWQGASALPEKGMNVGLFFKLYGPAYSLPSAFMAFGEFNYGLNARTQLGTTIGIGMLDLYVGVQVKTNLVQREGFSLGVMAGLHRQKYYYVDGYLIASYEWRFLEFYLAPIMGICLNTFQTYFGLLPGIDLAVTENTRIYLQGDLNIVGHHFAGSVGVRRTF